MNFINLTPHIIKVVGDDIDTHVFPTSGSVARVATTVVADGIIGGIKMFKTVYGEVVDLPEPVKNTIYIVSSMVGAIALRSDVVAPSALVRDEGGKPIGCLGFNSFV